MLYFCLDTQYSKIKGRYKMFQRKQQAISRFQQIFGSLPALGCSVPGRVELCGNHTDHQHGCVIAAAIDLGMLAVARKTDDFFVSIHSEQSGSLQVDLRCLQPQTQEAGSSAGLVRGVAAWLAQAEIPIGGFQAYITSEIPIGSGLSSSAAFEVLIAALFNRFYAADTLSPQTLAFAAQHAENVYFGKPSGMMDQLTCATGGICAIDFALETQPQVRSLYFDCADYGYQLFIVNTHSSHAHLTDAYASIPREMTSVAQALGKSHLRECDPAQFYANLPILRRELGDRPLLRAHHFFTENDRVHRMASIIDRGDFTAFLQLLRQSGASSFQYLQNVFLSSAPEHQALSLALAYSEHLLQGEGAVRVHGGGFAGTILAIVPNPLRERYALEMDTLFGKGSAIPLQFYPHGIYKEF